MQAKQQGFTLIELVMVIVILGVLSAVALPKFVSVDVEAKQAALQGIAGGLSSANAINYASRKVASGKGVQVHSCADVENALQGGLSDKYVIAGTSPTVADETSTACTVGPVPADAAVPPVTFSATYID